MELTNHAAGFNEVLADFAPLHKGGEKIFIGVDPSQMAILLLSDDQLHRQSHKSQPPLPKIVVQESFFHSVFIHLSRIIICARMGHRHLWSINKKSPKINVEEKS